MQRLYELATSSIHNVDERISEELGNVTYIVIKCTLVYTPFFQQIGSFLKSFMHKKFWHMSEANYADSPTSLSSGKHSFFSGPNK